MIRLRTSCCNVLRSSVTSSFFFEEISIGCRIKNANKTLRLAVDVETQCNYLVVTTERKNYLSNGPLLLPPGTVHFELAAQPPSPSLQAVSLGTEGEAFVKVEEERRSSEAPKHCSYSLEW